MHYERMCVADVTRTVPIVRKRRFAFPRKRLSRLTGRLTRGRSAGYLVTTAASVKGPATGAVARVRYTTVNTFWVLRPTTNPLRISISPDNADNDSLDDHFV